MIADIKAMGHIFETFVLVLLSTLLKVLQRFLKVYG